MTEQSVCKFCLKASNNFQVIEEIKRKIVDDLLSKIDFSVNEDYVMCESCADSIYTFFKFKSACLHTEDRMAPFIRTMNGMKVDIVELAYLKENSDDTTNNSGDAICRLCLKRDRCVDLNVFNGNFAEDIIAKCVPEVDIKSTRDPKVCLSCQTSLINYYQFVNKCLVKQENIIENQDRKAWLAVKSEELDIKMEDECDRNRSTNLSLIHSSVMPEDTEIKYFEGNSYNQETNPKSIKRDPSQSFELEMEYPKSHNLFEDVTETRYYCYHCPYVTKRKGDLSKHILIHQKPLKTRAYQCSFCSYKPKQRFNLIRHMLIHKDASEVTTYQCTQCPYNAKQKSYLTSHMLIHKDASEITTYDCSFCSYKAKRKGELTKHMLIHKDSSEVTTYQCAQCPYNAKQKSYLTSHMLIHKDASEITTYDCSFCSYKAKRKRELTKHALIHKNASEVTTYQCKFCSYKAKWKICVHTRRSAKGHLTQHMVIHKDASEVKTYDCSCCPYKAKQKSNLRRHMLIHQDASKVTTYQCALCPYRAKRKTCLSKHMVIHKCASEDASKVTTHDCSFCSYKAKRKEHLTQHMLIHQSASDVTTYQCTLCPYNTKRKMHLTSHMLIHQDASEVTTYQCNLCSYKTKWKGYLPIHMRRHEGAAEVTSYDCSFCQYKTNQKQCLSKHMLSHQDVLSVRTKVEDADFTGNQHECTMEHHESMGCLGIKSEELDIKEEDECDWIIFMPIFNNNYPFRPQPRQQSPAEPAEPYDNYHANSTLLALVTSRAINASGDINTSE
ncbi:hypothetical protein NQ318_004947 [Aromia moschata]|uniref:Protein hunchback n=1 Tax=Aromia moschata TaxID=1265417 RepID=A0AAV8XH51_9CUCU|nr:hypothetical protein NQ318_004947 [Aromia moschata]